MNNKIEPADFSKAMEALLTEYGEDVQKDADEAIKATAKEVTKRLKKAGKYGTVSKKPYRKQFTYEVTKTRLTTVATVGNKKAGLTHLLEFGHATRNGGRNTKAFGFMAPINEETEEIFLKEFNKV